MIAFRNLITVAVLLGLLTTGALVPSAPAQASVGAAVSASPPDGAPPPSTGSVHAIAPDGSRVYPSHAMPAPPGRLDAAAGWHPAFVMMPYNAVRIRTRPVTGTVLGLMPSLARLWVSCWRQVGNQWWMWITWNSSGDRWITGWTYDQYLELDPPAWIPNC